MLTESRPEHILNNCSVYAQVLTAYQEIMDYLVVNPGNVSPVSPKDFDLVIIAGSSRVEVVRYAASIFGESPLVICSGKNGLKTQDWGVTEGYFFKRIFQARNPKCKRVESEENARNCDENFLNSIERGRKILGRPLKDVAICSVKYVQRRFQFLHKIHEGCDHLTLFSPPLPQAKTFEELVPGITVAAGEISRLDWMRSRYLEVSGECLPQTLLDHNCFLASLGLTARPVATKDLFNK